MSFSSIPSSPGPIRRTASPRARPVPYSGRGNSISISSQTSLLGPGIEPQNENSSPFDQHPSIPMRSTSDHYINTQYPMYTPPSSTPVAFRGHGFGLQASSHDYNSLNVNRNGDAYSAPQDIDKLVNLFGLHKDRESLHNFSNSSLEDRMTLFFCELLKSRDQVKELAAELNGVKASVKRIEQATQQDWAPSKEQETLFKSLLRHYIIKPQNSYMAVPEIVGIYMRKHHLKLRLGCYVTDATVREKVDENLMAQYHNIKSNLRKAVWTGVKNGVPLSQFATNIVAGYHLPKIPKEVPEDVLAALALLRDVAAPLVNKPNARGGDTGFWKNVEKELERLCKTYGNKRDSEGWKLWRVEMIEKDKAAYSRRSADAAPATHDDIAAAAMASIAGPSGVLADDSGVLPTEDIDETEVAVEIPACAMNGNIEIDSLDLAADAL